MFGCWQENACTWGLEQNLWYVHMTCHFVLPFSLARGVVEAKSPCKCHTGKKRPKIGKD